VNGSAAAMVDVGAWVSSRIGAYLELTKPRVLCMILITALAGFYMGSAGEFDLRLALRLLLGTALAAGGTLALNQYFERDVDAIMRRTQSRPLPSRRVQPSEALILGLLLGLVGIVYLYAKVNPLSAFVTLLISLLYLGCYTPMKRFTWLCHIIGAIPGALPPVIGWAASSGSARPEAFVLFGIMALWQLPHSLSIARIYQDDYARAGLSLLPWNRGSGNPVNSVMVAASGLLVGFGAVPTWVGLAGRAYLIFAITLGLWMLYSVIRLAWGGNSIVAARNVMLVSLIYLPTVLLIMVCDKT
jgi:protoheme IX farnesyltransferase